MKIEQICQGSVLFGLGGNRIKNVCLFFLFFCFFLLVFSPNIIFTYNLKHIQHRAPESDQKKPSTRGNTFNNVLGLNAWFYK